MSDVRAQEAGLAALLSVARTQPAAMSAGLVAPLATDTIFFGGGLPDPVKHPTDAMTRLLIELLAAPQGQLLGYCHGAGDDDLRLAIARNFSAREDRDISPDQIVVTNGSSGALSLLAVALIEPGDVVVCEALTYPGVLATFRQMGARIVPVAVDADGICPDELASTLTRLRAERARVKFLYTIATCHSPTGTVLSEGRRRELIDIADRFDMLIVQDATYADIRFDARFPREMITLAPHRTVHVASFSKTLAPGLRMGWMAGPPAIVDVLAQMRTDLGTSRLVQRMVARLITDGDFDTHLREVNGWYRQKRDVVVDALTESCAGLGHWNVPAGGFFVWLVLDGVDLSAVVAAGAQHGVGFFGAPYFAAEAAFVAGLPGIRLAYGELDTAQLAEGIHRLGRSIAAVA